MLGRKQGVQSGPRVFKGENFTNEAKNFLIREGHAPELLLEERDEIKRLALGLKSVNSRESRRLCRFTEEDKFVFNCLDDTINTLCKEVPHASRDLVLNALKINTLNIPQTYEYLKKPHLPNNEKLTFNHGDDHVIRYMKDSVFYRELIDTKGRDNVETREFFLS